MLRQISIAAVVAALALALGATSRAEMEQAGNLRITFDGGFSPRTLPRDKLAPVTVNVEGSIATTDGSHPPALRRLQVALNRNGKLSAVGLPTCPSAVLQSTSTESALATCRAALVGRGSFRADVAFSGQGTAPATGAILAFNSVHKGRPSLLLHLYVTVPVRATLVLPLTITHIPKGRYGTLIQGPIPKLAGGFGSITHIELHIRRVYRYRGEPRSYLSASCGAPAGFPGAVFPFARGTFLFGGDKRLHAILNRDCRVR